MSKELPRIISVDDHVVEPPDLWLRYLPAKFRTLAPHVVRTRGGYRSDVRDTWFADESGEWADIWHYEGYEMAINPGFAAVGKDQNALGDHWVPYIYDDMRPGCYQQDARLVDYDTNHTDASLAFPTFPRFCGQTFLQHGDRDLSLACVQAYNDWMIDEWCAGPGYGRLIPLTLVPIWDPKLATEEVYRCAEKGSHAICFPEAMHPLGLETLYSGAWEPMLRACDETSTVINMHIGSSSLLPGTSPDASIGVTVALTHENAAHALCDWVFSGVLVRHPKLKVVLSEAQAGWIPFMLSRMDDVWERGEMYGTDLRETLPEPPSTLVRSRIYSCIFNDIVGLNARNEIGMEHLMFEVDYPHSDSTFPLSMATAEKLIAEAGLNDEEAVQFVRGNAIECYDLGRWGIVK